MLQRLVLTILVVLACAHSALAAPTIIITAPADQAAYAAPATITLTAEAASSDSTIAQVAFYKGEALIGSTTTAPYTVEWTNVGAGNYSITAVATDATNASTTSGPVTVTVTAAAPPAQVYYIDGDQLNTPRLITDQANNVVWTWDSDPFSAALPNQDPGNTGTSFVFNPRAPGQYFDKETNLHYNWHRTYDPQTGRYIESDPIGLVGGINTYAYVNSQPTRYTDPLGLNPAIAIQGAGGGSVVAGGIAGSGRGGTGNGTGYNPITDMPTGIPPSSVVSGTGLPASFCLVAPAICATIIAANKPPRDAHDPNGAKAPGKPGEAEGFCDPKGGESWVRNPNGRGFGWEHKDGSVWIPTGPDSQSTGNAHGGAHWDVQLPGRGYRNVKPVR